MASVMLSVTIWLVLQLNTCVSPFSSTSHLLRPHELSEYRQPFSFTHSTLNTWGDNRPVSVCTHIRFHLYTTHGTDREVGRLAAHAEQAGNPASDAGEHPLTLLHRSLVQFTGGVRSEPEQVTAVRWHDETPALKQQEKTIRTGPYGQDIGRNPNIDMNNSVSVAQW